MLVTNHSEMQCASSIATKDNFDFTTDPDSVSFHSDSWINSGDTNTNARDVSPSTLMILILFLTNQICTLP